MAPSEASREKGRERMRRYLARKRGQPVPMRKPGRPRKPATFAELVASVEEPLVKAPWENFLVPGNRALYLGSLNGFTHWELADQARSVLPWRFEEGAETYAALHRFFGRFMMTAVATGKDKELANLCLAAAWSPIEHVDDPRYFPEMYSADSSVENRAAISELVERSIQGTLKIAYEHFEYGRFLTPRERKDHGLED
jgi:hypothetical protein